MNFAEPGFTSTEFMGIGVAIAVVINILYQSEPVSKKPDPYKQYGAYRSYTRAITLSIIGIVLVAVTFSVCTWFLGWIAAGYLFAPICSMLSWISWKYFRSTATLPSEIKSGLAFLGLHQVDWAPRELELSVNGWGIFGGEHITNFDAGLTSDALYLHFDERLYLVPFIEVQTALPTEICRLDSQKYEHAIRFEFESTSPFRIAMTWPVEEIGSTIAKIRSHQ